MELNFDNSLITNYHSSSQIARILTENWVSKNMFCPRCGNPHLEHFENNRPVADFFCPNCRNEYELKSKNGNLQQKINDGAYNTMIARITSNENPDFFFMNYSKVEWKVKDLVFVPKYFFVPDIIERRKPLSSSARRAGWVGCNILIGKIPEQGQIHIVANGKICDRNNVIDKVRASSNFEIENIQNRDWLFDILSCINNIDNSLFSLEDVYKFEPLLHIKHPQNNNIRPKIRQQLQFLRDKGFIEFLGNGKYKKNV